MYSSRAVIPFTGRIALAVASPLVAQTPRPTAPIAEANAPVAMSACEVSGDDDVGYQGGNTTSGSRLNTSQRDTPAAIQVLTPEFMADFGLNPLEDIAAYGPNLGVDHLETRCDPHPAFISGVGPDTRLRVRGLEASAAVDFFGAVIPIDSYNTGRLEVSSGPNSILFGFGNPGDLENVITKRAALDRGGVRYHSRSVVQAVGQPEPPTQMDMERRSSGLRSGDIPGVRAPARTCFRHAPLCRLMLLVPAFAPAAIRAGFIERDLTPQIGQARYGGCRNAFHAGFLDPCEVRVAIFSDDTKTVDLVGLDALMIDCRAMTPGKKPEPPPLEKPGGPWLFGNVPPQLD